uniref:Fibronectin type-III domain-containing protein n=1 Tax=Seriola lalandi dorsalis TaxID=1841481 RepID=A0A3B4YUT5_SERLL
MKERKMTSKCNSWPEKRQNGKIAKYSVLYKDINSRGNASEVMVPAPGSSVLLEGLSADTVYDVRVCAFTAVGPGPYSPSVQFRTQRLDEGRTNSISNNPSSLLRMQDALPNSTTVHILSHMHTHTHTTSDDNILRRKVSKQSRKGKITLSLISIIHDNHLVF